ncbi:hypothetical protein BDK51DRAFT_51593 [Blyttiomyces helicus]|uniref:Uncharacterized protein n=1 Tax=Blyttiomyces helicus TaxID=388810 RepID=A0A4P9WFQ4_9FUNG|nr:hypothetical protein BDK51DRAFT_51593 [Blyttiomyces helicus]|eukprot:RKO91474.1 hypothetical protein BDK51DRAFT_51593 [Blyttiomyces helicus]
MAIANIDNIGGPIQEADVSSVKMTQRKTQSPTIPVVGRPPNNRSSYIVCPRYVSSVDRPAPSALRPPPPHHPLRQEGQNLQDKTGHSIASVEIRDALKPHLQVQEKRNIPTANEVAPDASFCSLPLLLVGHARSSSSALFISSLWSTDQKIKIRKPPSLPLYLSHPTIGDSNTMDSSPPLVLTSSHLRGFDRHAGALPHTYLIWRILSSSHPRTPSIAPHSLNASAGGNSFWECPGQTSR